MKHPLCYLFLTLIGVLIFSCNDKTKKEVNPTQEEYNIPKKIDSSEFEKSLPETEENIPNKAKKNKRKTAPLDTLRPKIV
ncbi:MAG: hypothetical protein COA50_03430 [Flavobacteriaceae bacterium]|nr:MAG: hypothetical protein COA50_03430 [Flavobacteriaceae bacterium]